MKLVRYLMLAAAFAAPSAVLAQNGRETSGVQAAPLSMIDDAHRQFARGDLPESAKDLRSAASLLRVEGQRYSVAERSLIDASAANLESLASGIDGKAIKTTEQFDKAAAAAVVPKAKAHHAAAAKAWSARERARTGEEILAASHALEHGWKWLEGSVSKDSREFLARAEVAAEKLKKGKSVAEADVSGLLEAVEKQIVGLEKKTTSPKASH